MYVNTTQFKKNSSTPRTSDVPAHDITPSSLGITHIRTSMIIISLLSFNFILLLSFNDPLTFNLHMYP